MSLLLKPQENRTVLTKVKTLMAEKVKTNSTTNPTVMGAEVGRRKGAGGGGRVQTKGLSSPVACVDALE